MRGYRLDFRRGKFLALHRTIYLISRFSRSPRHSVDCHRLIRERFFPRSRRVTPREKNSLRRESMLVRCS